MRHLKFLFAAYEGKYWYWEVVESYRKVFLTGVLVVVQQESTTQVVVGILVALLFIKLYNLYEPFEDDKVDVISELAQWQIFIVLFIGLLIRDTNLTDTNGGFFNVILAIACVATVALEFVQSCVELISVILEQLMERNYFTFMKVHVASKEVDSAGKLHINLSILYHLIILIF